MCDCIKRMNEKLLASNARLTVVYGIDDEMNLTHTACKIVTEKIDKAVKGSKPRSLVGSFCPFCGVKIGVAS